ncbi:hypothetical protein KOW79_009483 [Hemibagrus wyckioides]|uniref:Cystatin domain-containing protein n=1 Tax=Hemibagrus wyckioides TaxID=337641 RepID=A0A9D3SKZ2_9TELE|nr:alpha-2-HS-glycoprotein 1 [Hemibagrus wyckioides]KAG7327877.1 hypothetical protein KOW79_009483 [Hemibagrus wyckioides]
MRGLLILAVLCQGLFATSASDCRNYTAQAAAEEAEYLINRLHHHGYKFKLDSFTEEQSTTGQPSCLNELTLTLSETKCHIVNPKPFNECEIRQEYDTPVTAKCNVTFCDGGDKPGIARLICDTEPVSPIQLTRVCPDCPTLLPLHDPQGLESVKAAIEKFNKDSNQTSYFKVLEVGRLRTQNNMMFGMSHFAEFAIVETECGDDVKEKTACKQKCPSEAHHGFCKSTQLGNGDLTVDCEIYDIQNTTHHPHPPFHRGKHCGKHERHPHGPGHHERHPHGPGHHESGEHEGPPGHGKKGKHEGPPGHGEKGKHETRPGHPARPGQPEHPEHATSTGPLSHRFCFTRSSRGPPHHGGHPHHRGPPHHRDHGEHDHGHKKPHPKPDVPNAQPTPPGSEESPDFSFPHCHGAVKIPPSIHPICPFPPSFHRGDHH